MSEYRHLAKEDIAAALVRSADQVFAMLAPYQWTEGDRIDVTIKFTVAQGGLEHCAGPNIDPAPPDVVAKSN